ncbi:MAG: 6-phosphogluconolactonase [Acidobacteriota bacterium]|nr:6-phosphogluconolactonase [Acidobacteriota bacterium]
MSKIKIAQDLSELNILAAEKFVSIGNQAIEKSGQFTVALAGGSTPKLLYQLLAGDAYKNRIDWKRVFFFFGDERNVLPTDEDSNFRMANENLLKPLQIPEENIFRWQTESKDAAENYEETIRKFFDLTETKFPRLDLILLGMGEDGHTASLFPFTEALTEKSRIAVENWVEKLDAKRFTLTFPVINNASNIIFLISGASKAEVLREVLEGEFRGEKFPSQNVNPTGGNLIWLIDTDSARILNSAFD